MLDLGIYIYLSARFDSPARPRPSRVETCFINRKVPRDVARLEAITEDIAGTARVSLSAPASPSPARARPPVYLRGYRNRNLLAGTGEQTKAENTVCIIRLFRSIHSYNRPYNVPDNNGVANINNQQISV